MSLHGEHIADEVATLSNKESTLSPEEERLSVGLDRLIKAMVYPNDITESPDENVDDIFRELGIVSGQHEGDFNKDKLDNKRLYTWYLGQIKKLVDIGMKASTKADALLMNTERYCDLKYYGSNMEEIFNRFEKDRRDFLVEFKKRHSYNQGWVKGSDPLYKAIFGSGDVYSMIDNRDKYEGQRVAVVTRPENLDQRLHAHEGLLMSKKSDGRVLFYIQVGTREIKLNANDIEIFCVKDSSDPTYREIIKELSKKGYKNIFDNGNIKAEDELVLVLPKENSPTWETVKATALEDKKIGGGGGYPKFKVQIGSETVECNTNELKKTGEGAVCFVKTV